MPVRSQFRHLNSPGTRAAVDATVSAIDVPRRARRTIRTSGADMSKISRGPGMHVRPRSRLVPPARRTCSSFTKRPGAPRPRSGVQSRLLHDRPRRVHHGRLPVVPAPGSTSFDGGRVHRYPRQAHDPHLLGVRGGSFDDCPAGRPGGGRGAGTGGGRTGGPAATAARQGTAASAEDRQLAAAGGRLLGRGRDAGAEDLRHRGLHADDHQGSPRSREDRRRAGRLQAAGADAGRSQESDRVVHARTGAPDGAPGHRRDCRERRGRRRGVHRRCVARDGAQFIRAGRRPAPDRAAQGRLQAVFGLAGGGRGGAAHTRRRADQGRSARGHGAGDVGPGR